MMAKRISCLCILLLFVLGIPSTCQAKSVYAITQHSVGSSEPDDGPFVKAYKAVDNEIEEQATIDQSAFGAGPVGITVSEAWDMIFITYESDSIIVCISAKTLEKKRDYQTGVTNLAGIVADDENEKLYVVQRTSGQLYVYHWDIDNETLVLEEASESQDYYQLKEQAGTNLNSFGLALDSVNDLLLVTDASDTVCRYETEGFAYSDEVQNPTDRKAVGIAYNETGYMYTGGYSANNNYLVRVDVNDPNQFTNTIEIYVGSTATGLAVDNETGYLYCTTHHNDVRVYDSNLELQYTVTNTETGPAGIAVGSLYKPSDQIGIIKVDNIDPNDVALLDCVVPDDDITYTITVSPNGYDHEWVTVTDDLPVGVTYEYFDWATMTEDPNYSIADHTYTWQLGPLQSTDDPVVLTLTVTTNDMANPASLLKNKVTVESDIAYREAFENTEVCCWGGDIIFVDSSNLAGGSGTSWATSYNDLNDALIRADLCGGDEIEVWVAGGIYPPGNDSVDSFELPDGVAVYGGFAGNETLRDERDWIANKTVLTGGGVNNYTVTMGDNCLLDGCVVSNALYDGIYGEDVDFELVNCVVKGNKRHGVSSKNSSTVVHWSIVKGNAYDGIRHEGSGYLLTIDNCKIYGNLRNGVHLLYSTAKIYNSEIYHNGNSASGTYYGVKLYQPSDNPRIRNCTVANNTNESIYYTGSNTPTITNCIIWNNNGTSEQIDGDIDIYYSCVNGYGADPNNNPTIPDANDNIGADPLFAYSDHTLGNFHLDPNSPCKNIGESTFVDPNGFGMYDIDGQDRVYGIEVDMGADEITCSDVSYWVDYNADGVVDYVEFAAFGNSWAMTPNDPNWSDTHVNYDYDIDNDVDIDDLTYWADGWCWTACWLEGNGSVYDKWLTPVAGAQQSSMMMPIGAESLAVEAQPVEKSFFTSDEIIDFFEAMLDDKEVLELIDRRDLKMFIKSLESSLTVDLP